MARREFTRAVRVAVVKRCTRNGVLYCEGCGLPTKLFQIDHIRPDGLLGEPTLENAQLLCQPCWSIKNPQDTTAIAKAKRREAAALGAKAAPKTPIHSAGFAPSQRSVDRAKREPKLPIPPRRSLYAKDIDRG